MKVYLPWLLLFIITSSVAQSPLNLKVNFQDQATATPSGYVRDFGESYGTRSDGNVFGWLKKSDKTPLSLTNNGRKRNTPSDVLLATFMHMQANDNTTAGLTHTEGIWECKVANGGYKVTVSAGDGGFTDSKHSINIEGVAAISNFVPTSSTKFKSATLNVNVSDGRLTVDATGGTNTKINYITIQPTSGSLTAPEVTITVPAPNANFTAPATITMTATVAGISGTVSKLEFFDGTALLNTQRTSPYTFVWKSVPAGNYALKAIVTDNSGNTFESASVPVSVTSDNAQPAVLSVNPANGAKNIQLNTSISTTSLKLPNSGIDNNTLTSANVFLTKAGVNVPASVSGTAQGDAITLVPSSPLDSNTTYSFNVTAGVKDLSGASFIPFTSTFTTVAPVAASGPVVSITTPAPNAKFTPPATITMTAAASETNGTITSVDFFNGTTLINTQHSSPYTFVWKNVAAGNYVLTARATDSKGNSATSSPVPVSVGNGAQPSVVSVNPANGAKNISVSTSVSTTALNLPNGGIDNATLTSSNVFLTDAGAKVTSIVSGTTNGDAITLVPSAALKANTVYTFNITSGVKDKSGASFVPFTSTFTTAGTAAVPVVNLTSPVANANFTPPATITLTATATETNGTISMVEFFNGTTLLNTQHSSPYSFDWKNVPAGTYTLSAKATDSKGTSATSAPVTVIVGTSGKPSVVSVNPANGATNVSVTASVATTALNLPNSAVDNNTLTSTNVYLSSAGAKVSASVTGNVSGNAITLTPSAALKPATAYTFNITSGVKDKSGVAFVPFTSTFTTASAQKPVVTITAPAANAKFTPPATIAITATATETNGTISKVEFFNGTSLLGTATTSPYTFSWKNVAAGNYSLTAKATDKNGNSTTSSPVPIIVAANQKPTVVSVNPANGSTNVSVNTSVTTNVLNLPNGGINNNTLTSSNVYLTKAGAKVAATVNGTGGGDAIILTPSASLTANTTYTFNITSGVKDLSGTSFTAYTSTFKTGATPPPVSTTIKFTKVSLPNSTGKYTSLAIGPDGKLYALADDGVIHRFAINADGTLGTPQLIYSLQDSGGVRKPTLAVGFAFDPAATASNLIAWVTHCRTYVFENAPDWDDKLTKLTGPDLKTAKDVLINLPRSAKDHVTNGIAFGPDKALYFSQGSVSGMGMADNIWNNRSEHLLNAAILRLDVSKLGTLPLNVKTADGGGSYNPYATNAPLTIYASGVRNAYNIVWHSNGSLYAPANGSAPGSNTPVSVPGTRRPDGSTYSGPAVPSLLNVQQTMFDYLFRVVKGGYYGHPNPLRGEYVLNGGNPTSGKDAAEVTVYPVGTLPDANWRGSAFDFKNNCSPDGALEYKSNTFGGALKGKLLVARYSAHDDIMTLTLNSSTKNVSSSMDGVSVPGFSGFVDPLALVEDVKTGNIYVSEYGGKKITLLKPDTSPGLARRSAADSVVYPNPEFVSENYPNVNSACDDNSSAMAMLLKSNNNQIKLNPFGAIKVNPNPATKRFTIEISNQYSRNFKIQITDAVGKMYEIRNPVSKNLRVEVDATRLGLKPGTYFVKLVTEGGDSQFCKLILL